VSIAIVIVDEYCSLSVIFSQLALTLLSWKIVFLRAQNNQFSGLLPTGLTQLKKLREVYLYNNNLWSDIPPDIGLMEDLGMSYVSVVRSALGPYQLDLTNSPVRRLINQRTFALARI
jgi:hypothetical protein